VKVLDGLGGGFISGAFMHVLAHAPIEK